MKYLLDVNVLLAGVHTTHTEHHKTFAWLDGKEIVLCPLTELGFLRISTQPLPFGSNMATARKALEKFAADRFADRVADDLPALDAHPRTSKEVTDAYLSELAAKHGFKLATLDGAIRHPSAVLVT